VADHNVPCPLCGRTDSVSLIGAAYTAWQVPVFRCYNGRHGEYCFHAETPEAWKASGDSIGKSRANAVEYAEKTRGTP